MPIRTSALIAELEKDYTKRAYVAPTVFLLAGQGMPGNWNYYSSSRDAINKILHLLNAGGYNVTPAGSIQFQRNGKAQTLGINVDFYVAVTGKGWVPTGYQWMKDNYNSLNKYAIYYRFYTVTGEGPFYAIFDKKYFGFSATVLNNVETAKLQELDLFHREVQRLKFRFNSLVAFQNTLAKRQLNAVEQQIFNEGMLKVQAMSNQIGTLKGLEIYYSENGQIGNPALLLIALIAIIAAATAWATTTIATEREKTRRINDSYDLGKWIAEKKTTVAQQVTAGNISADQAKNIYDTLDQSQRSAETVANNASKPQDNFFTGAANLVKWATLAFLAIKGTEYFLNRNKKESAA